MTEDKKPDSPIIQILTPVWKHGIGSGSWVRFNAHLRSTLFDAIEGGVEFKEGDFAEIEKRFQMWHWIGEDGIENAYRSAVAFDNFSCWRVIEVRNNRKPFIVTRATYEGRGLRTVLPEKVRLAVGFSFKWNEEKVTVTSFNDEAGAIVACSYEETPTVRCMTCKGVVSWPQRIKIKKRYTITNAELLERRKSAKGNNQTA